jgi:hypothetical protein
MSRRGSNEADDGAGLASTAARCENSRPIHRKEGVQMTETAESPTHPEKPQPQKEHQWLAQLVGEWTFEGEATMGPEKPPEKFKGIERVRSLGDLWFLAEGEIEAPSGGAATTIATLGFDPQKNRFVGTFIGSMMTHLWIYDGGLDAAEKVLTLDTEGPGMSGDGKMAPYRDVIEIESSDRRSMSSHLQGEDGTWTQFMKMTYQRMK